MVCKLLVLFLLPYVSTQHQPRCNGQNDGCCTLEKPCEIGDGDCDADEQCAGGDKTRCGDGNCPLGFGFSRTDDCCELDPESEAQKDVLQGSKVVLSDAYRCNGVNDDCCTEDDPCEVNDGDCDNDLQCKGENTRCGMDNCPEGFGFTPSDDCCEEIPSRAGK